MYIVDKRLVGFLALLLCVLEVGCRGGHAMLHVDQSANNTDVSMSLKELVEISLTENQTAGYLWELKTTGQPVCILRSENFDPPAPGPAGASGVHKWRFEAVKTGSAKIELVYRRPWEQDKPPDKTFQITALVQN